MLRAWNVPHVDLWWRGWWHGLKLRAIGRATAHGHHMLVTGFDLWPKLIGNRFLYFSQKGYTYHASERVLNISLSLLQKNLCSFCCISGITYYKWLHKPCILSLKKKNKTVSFWYLISTSPTPFPYSAGGAWAIHVHQTCLVSSAFFLFSTSLSPAKEHFFLYYSYLHPMLFWPQTLPLPAKSLCAFISRVLFPIISWDFGAHFNGSRKITNILTNYNSFSIRL